MPPPLGPPARFCAQCGAALVQRIPAGEDRERPVCEACSHVHYENPKTVVGCLVEHEGRLLLCRRAIEPAHGLWTVPAGYLELEESAVEGAVRETQEEALATVEVVAPHAYLDIPHIGQTYALFRARLQVEHDAQPAFGVGAESLETRLFAPSELPFGELAFPVIRFALELFLADSAKDRRHLHVGVVRWSGGGSRFDAANYGLEDHMAVPLARGG